VRRAGEGGRIYTVLPVEIPEEQFHVGQRGVGEELLARKRIVEGW
jgi:hypothetical protein